MIIFYKEVLDSLVANKVKFVLIGGFAVNAYGFQRATGDMDLLIEPTEENIEQLLKSIDALGFDRLEAKKSFSHAAGMLLLTDEPYRVDLLTKINLPLSFETIYARSEERTIFEVTFRVIGYSDLIDEKARSKRDKDLLDIVRLEEIRRMNKE